MKKTTKQLARQVQQALLALPDTILLETIDQWLEDFDELFEDTSMTDGYYEVLGYRARSKTTERHYASLEALYEAEPAAEDISWTLPPAQELQDILRKMQPDQVYHQIVALAGDVFRRKPCVAHWGGPPGDQCDGYSFMRSLASYLALRKEGGGISTELFEALYGEQLEALAAPDEAEGEDFFVSFPGMFTDESTFHFRVVFSQPSEQQHRALLQALQKYDCPLSELQLENGIEGCLSHIHWHQNDLKRLARVRRLLNRWQHHGWITWTEWREKPPKRKSPQKPKRKVKRM